MTPLSPTVDSSSFDSYSSSNIVAGIAFSALTYTGWPTCCHFVLPLKFINGIVYDRGVPAYQAINMIVYEVAFPSIKLSIGSCTRRRGVHLRFCQLSCSNM